MATNTPGDFAAPIDPNKYILAKTKMLLEVGLLGRLFGARGNAPANIAGLSIVLLLVVGFSLTLCPGTNENAKGIWPNILPIVGVALGYLFGRNTK